MNIEFTNMYVRFIIFFMLAASFALKVIVSDPITWYTLVLAVCAGASFGLALSSMTNFLLGHTLICIAVVSVITIFFVFGVVLLVVSWPLNPLTTIGAFCTTCGFMFFLEIVNESTNTD